MATSGDPHAARRRSHRLCHRAVGRVSHKTPKFRREAKTASPLRRVKKSHQKGPVEAGSESAAEDDFRHCPHGLPTGAKRITFMQNFPSRLGKLAAVALVGAATGLIFQSPAARFFVLPSAYGQTAGDIPPATPGNPINPVAQPAPSVSTAAPTKADEQSANNMVHSDENGRRLAPHDTFYLLSYVAVKTGAGVEGFDPGQEVHLVEVHRPTHTLVVSDGRAQVEVTPDELTNDMDVAAMVRQKDQANQAKITAYTQAEKEAYDKFEREAAENTAKDLENRKQAQKEATQEKIAEEQAPVAQIAPSQNAPISTNGYYANGYYGNGGFGYGNPYSYFVESSAAPAANSGSAKPAAPANGGAATSKSSKAAAPVGGGRAK